jgi:MFS family permease
LYTIAGTSPFVEAPVLTATFRRNEGFRALRHRGYRIYFLSMFARGTGIWMLFVAIPWLAVERGATPFELGLVSGSLFLPALFIAPLGGVMADRVDRTAIMLATQLGGAIHALVLLLVVASGVADIGVLILFSLLFGVFTAVELPVRQSYLTDLVPAEDVSSAVSLHATAWNSTRFLGPGLAGVLVATVGVIACFAVVFVASLAVGLSTIVLRGFRRHARSVPQRAGSVLGALRDGIRFASADRRIRWALVVLSSTGILGIQAFQTLAPLYVSETLGLGGGGYGAFMASWGAGALVGTFVVTMFARGDRRRWFVAGAGTLAVLLAALAMSSWPPASFALAGALGLAQISTIQNVMITVQQATTDEYRGRVMGLYGTVFQGTNPIGAVLAGVLAGMVGVSGAMLVGAAGLGAVALAAAVRMEWRSSSP